jgi:hypothetical protein
MDTNSWTEIKDINLNKKIRKRDIKFWRNLIGWLISNWGWSLSVPMHPGLKNGPFVPHNLIPVQGNTVPLLQFQMTPPRFKLLMFSGSKEKESSWTRLSETKASHSQRVWAEVSSSAPHLLHKGQSFSRITYRCLLRVLCPVRRPVTTLDSVLLKGKGLVFVAGLGPKINSRSCLWVLSDGSTCGAAWVGRTKASTSVENECEKWVWKMSVKNECEKWVWKMSVKMSVKNECEKWVWKWVWKMSVKNECEKWVKKECEKWVWKMNVKNECEKWVWKNSHK